MKIETWDTDEIELNYLGFISEAFDSGSYRESWLHEILCSIEEDWFADSNRKMVYRAACKIATTTPSNSFIPPNAIAIQAEADSNEASGWAHRLVETARSNTHVFHHAILLEEVIPVWRIKAGRKRMLDVNRKISDALTENPNFNEVVGKIGNLLEREQSTWMDAISPRKASTNNWEETIEEILSPLPENDSVPTGIKILDETIGGGLANKDSANAGRLIVIAARPAMGKTSLAITLGSQLAKHGNGCVFFSFEMPAKQIQYKSIACLDYLQLQEKGQLINPLRTHNIAKRAYTQEQRERILEMNANSLNDNFLIYDGNHSLASICTTIKTLCNTRPNLKAVIIDYLQLIPECREGQNEASAIGAVTRALKVAALANKIDIILLSQVNRAVEGRNEKVPTLSDLRASGRIEEDADIVMFLYRHHYYDPAADEGEMMISVAKNRNGITGSLYCRVDLASSVVFG